MPQLLDVNANLVEGVGDLAIHRSQEIPDDFLQHLKALRSGSDAPAGEMHHAVSVPVAVHEVWLRQGFDMFHAPAREIIARLRREGLDDFIVTNKRL
jgi:hypothetical protein